MQESFLPLYVFSKVMLLEFTLHTQHLKSSLKRTYVERRAAYRKSEMVAPFSSVIAVSDTFPAASLAEANSRTFT
jgi:hypothetical protein